MSALTYAANDEDGDTIDQLRAENAQLRKSLMVPADAYDRLEALCQRQAERIIELEDEIDRQPLTDEQLEKVFPAIATYTEANKTLYRSIARAIEAAHGIKEQK